MRRKSALTPAAAPSAQSAFGLTWEPASKSLPATQVTLLPQWRRQKIGALIRELDFISPGVQGPCRRCTNEHPPFLTPTTITTSAPSLQSCHLLPPNRQSWELKQEAMALLSHFGTGMAARSPQAWWEILRVSSGRRRALTSTLLRLLSTLLPLDSLAMHCLMSGKTLSRTFAKPGLS